ncbi:RNA-binding S4 domain-containing protein [Wandonia haliotis]|uniref:RNA-binding S4 domain-containing protein n=1 Tax=Wandonia haliotis TaxID=574963 RepID=A0ABN1MPI4_9FLAO
MAVRIDKYVWCVRLTKTRSQATEQVKKGKIRLNGEDIKPSREVKVGDKLSFSRNGALFEYKILALLDKRVGAKLVPEYLSEETTPEELEKYKLYQESQKIYRDYGTGKPTKKDRRDLSDFWEGWDDWDEE